MGEFVEDEFGAEALGDDVDIPADVAADLKAKHGDVIAVGVGACGAFAFRRASQASHEKMLNGVAGDDKAVAIREYVVACLVWPTLESGRPNYDALHAAFRMNPEAPTTIFAQLQELAPKLKIKKL